MAFSEVEVERIVREVLGQLAGEQSGRRSDRQVQANGRNNGSAARLTVAAQVVSTGQLEGRLKGVRRVTVLANAVITPAARDLLRSRNVAIVHEDAPAIEAAGRIPLLVGIAKANYDPAPLVRLLDRDGAATEKMAESDLVQIIEHLAGPVGEGEKLGLLITDEPAVGLCLANRHRGVRAALGYTPGDVAKAVESVGANMLVIDPTGRSSYQLNQTVMPLCRSWPRRCPSTYDLYLG